MCRSEHSFQESGLPFNHLGPRGPTQAIRLGGFFLTPVFLFSFKEKLRLKDLNSLQTVIESVLGRASFQS